MPYFVVIHESSPHSGSRRGERKTLNGASFFSDKNFGPIQIVIHKKINTVCCSEMKDKFSFTFGLKPDLLNVLGNSPLC